MRDQRRYIAAGSLIAVEDVYKRQTETSLQWKLVKYLLAFVIALLALLWLFQVVFLDSFYQRFKIEGIEKIGNTLAANLESCLLYTSRCV